MREIDDRTREILLGRARDLARRGRVDVRQNTGESVAVFHIGAESMALPVRHLKSIIRLPVITPVPGLPAWMVGILQVQGTVLSVVDLACWLGLPARMQGCYLALLELKHRSLGILVEAVAGVREIFVDEIVENQASNSVPGALPVRWTTRDLVAVLDVERLFELADRRRKVPVGESASLTTEVCHA